MKDIMEVNSKLFLYRDKSGVEISLIHNEYPTNFLYKSNWLTNTKNIDYDTFPKEINIDRILHEIELTQIINTFENGRNRGHYDLSILNKEFVNEEFSKDISLEEKLKIIISKKPRPMGVVFYLNLKIRLAVIFIGGLK
jgi:hypothetical protein